MRSAFTFLIVSALGLPLALGDEAGPQLELEAVQASNAGGQVDSQFAGLKRRFAHSGFSYSSYKLMGSHSGPLKQGAPVELKLPRNQLARCSLVEAKGPTRYELHLTAPGGTDLDTTVACGSLGIVELEHPAGAANTSTALFLSYRLRCPALRERGPDAGH